MPTSPIFGDLDFQQALQRLMPTGRIWRRDPEAVQTQVMRALAPSYTRSAAAALQLLTDANPTTTINLLPEWEQSLGLPDPCTVGNPSLEQRQAAVRAKWGARGSLTIDYFIALAANLGFSITITEFKPFSADDACDLPCYDDEWSFVWQINAPQVTLSYFSADEWSADDPLETYDNTELVCRITRDAPAGTLVIFQFGEPGDLYDDDDFLALAPGGSWPTSPAGLASGALWNNDGFAAIVPGATPDPLAPPVFFGSITAAAFLALGGANLPVADPGVLGQLWNNGGFACVSSG